jgi:DNA polymerase
MELTEELVNPDPKLFDPRFVGPKGPRTNVDIYIVGNAPGKEEAQQGLPFAGQDGKVLDRAISESEAGSARIRFFYPVPYRPLTKDFLTRAPARDAIKIYSVLLMTDIEKVRPKVILLTGRVAMTAFGILMPVGQARAGTFLHKGTPVLVTYHPAHVLGKTNWNFPLCGTSKIYNALVHDLNKAMKSAISKEEPPPACRA